MSAEPVSSRIEEARAIHRGGDLRRAISLYGEILGENPALASLWHLKGMAEHQAGHPALSREVQEAFGRPALAGPVRRGAGHQQRESLRQVEAGEVLKSPEIDELQQLLDSSPGLIEAALLAVSAARISCSNASEESCSSRSAC